MGPQCAAPLSPIKQNGRLRNSQDHNRRKNCFVAGFIKLENCEAAISCVNRHLHFSKKSANPFVCPRDCWQVERRQNQNDGNDTQNLRQGECYLSFPVTGHGYSFRPMPPPFLTPELRTFWNRTLRFAKQPKSFRVSVHFALILEPGENVLCLGIVSNTHRN